MRIRCAIASFAALLSATASAPKAEAANLFQRTFVETYGGAACYARTYDLAARRRGVPYRVTIDLNPGGPADGAANTAAEFAVRLSIQLQRNKFLYWSVASCTTKGAGFSCDVEADGGQFRLTRIGRALRLTTKRIQIEGVKADLDLSAPKGQSRYFTLKRTGRQTCARIYD